MARVTVEDCILQVPNRFELVMLAAQRARAISSGAPLAVDRDNDKNPVVALREIADDVVDQESLRDSLVRGRQKHLPMDDDEVEDDIIELMAGEEEMLARGIVAPALDGEEPEVLEAPLPDDEEDDLALAGLPGSDLDEAEADGLDDADASADTDDDD